jgi:hypothetical protein
VLLLLLFLSSPWVIGEGRVNDFLHGLETIDWRWWVMVPVLVVWGLPVLAVGAWLRARALGLETERLRTGLGSLLRDRQLPIAVDVDARVPVQVEAPLRVPVELDTTMSVDEHIDIETSVPLRADLPMDTVVETSVFGLGTIKVPIRATIPLDLVIPIKGRIRVKSDALPVKVKDECVVTLPVFEVPIQSRFVTRIDLLDNLRPAARRLREGVEEVLSAVVEPPPKP